MHAYHFIGIMSGTSLDGIDLAYCKFTHDEGWKYELIFFETLPYSNEWTTRLKNLEKSSALNYAKTHSDLGILLGNKCREFINKNNINALDGIASHGQTIFHQPQLGFTSQIGCGAQIAAITGIPTVCDFRTTDVAHGGQGAPLVPIGDELLFSSYDICLNLGGIANMSYKNNLNNRLSYDITFANMVSNHLVNQLQLPYDDGGNIAQSGKIVPSLLHQLNQLEYYSQGGPKSLGKEGFLNWFLPTINSDSSSIEDKLHTLGHHLSEQIVSTVRKTGINNPTMLVTGGGAYNEFWIDLIKKSSDINITIPAKEIIDFKEAIIFAFLGVLRFTQTPNCLASVTGARKDNVGGAIYL